MDVNDVPITIGGKPVDFSSIDSTHEAIDAIMSSRKGRKVERKIVTDREIGANGNEDAGDLKSAIDKDGKQTLYRKQSSGQWAEEGSRQDTWPEDSENLTDVEKGDILHTMEKKSPATSSLIPNAEAYLDNHLNVLLVALHGVGKTVSIMDLCRQRGLKFKYYSCSTLDPFTDLVGVPTPRQYCPKCKVYSRDDQVCQNEVDGKVCGERTVETLKMVRPREVDEAEVIFFDEFNRADSKTQNALFEIMQFKSINGEPLPNLKACWAAINPPDDEQNYQVEQLDPALLDRFDLYIDITPKPSVAYMSQHMPQPIAAALKVFWDDHANAIKNGTKDAHSDYISPRRLEKIGLVWCATKNTRSVAAALPMGGQFEKRKLIDLLKQAQRQVDKDNGVETAFDEDENENDLGGAGLGDRPAPQFTYRLANMRLEQDKLAEYLTKNPMHYATHEKVAEQLRQGVGGEEMVLKYGKILNALAASNLEGLVAGFPAAKVNEMRKGFIKLYQDSAEKRNAKKMQQLHKVLSKGVGNMADWPAKL